MLKYLLSAGTGYLLGSLNSGVIISKLAFLEDVRHHGSGNAGATNMARVFGLGAGILTLGCDMAKAIVSMEIGKKLAGDTGLAVAGAACIAGHCWPAYYHFKGGKGAAVGAATALMIGPGPFASAAAAFFAGALTTKKVSVGSVSGAVALPIACLLFKVGKPKQILACLASSIVLWEHRPNIKRLIEHTEPDFKAGPSRLIPKRAQ